jgi:putative acetyltransferase
MILRDERPEDAAAVHEVVFTAFGQPGEAGLVRALHADGDAVIALVGEDAGRIVGHVMFSRMIAPLRALALAPVAAEPDRQGHGIGSALIHAGIERARAEGWDAIFVLGDPGYYTRFGFAVEIAAGFSSPYAGAHFMGLALRPLPVTTGELIHAPAFAALD